MWSEPGQPGTRAGDPVRTTRTLVRRRRQDPLHGARRPCAGRVARQILARRTGRRRAEQTVVALNGPDRRGHREFFPRFMLTSSADSRALNLSTLFNWQSRVASISPSVSIPILEGGRLRANLDATRGPLPAGVART